MEVGIVSPDPSQKRHHYPQVSVEEALWEWLTQLSWNKASEVARSIPNPEIEGEQFVLPQHEKGSALPPQDSLDNVATDTLDLPLVGPRKCSANPSQVLMARNDESSSATAFPQLRSQQQQLAVRTHPDTPSPIPPTVSILMSLPMIEPLPMEHLQTWGAPRYVRIEETDTLHPTVDSAQMAQTRIAELLQGSPQLSPHPPK
ncbi:hypothetical protein ACLOJK_006921 [Asimina triloba]